MGQKLSTICSPTLLDALNPSPRTLGGRRAGAAWMAAARWVLHELLALLRPGGIALLQLPTYQKNYVFQSERLPWKNERH
jgi:hypothetical protein